MKKEWKICIAPYKLAYSILFLLLFALVRGVTLTSEIGPALMPGVAVLASVFCAETSVMDRNGQRWEIICLKPKKNTVSASSATARHRRLFWTGRAFSERAQRWRTPCG